MSALDWKRLKVVVGIPSLGPWTEAFGMSLARMHKYFLQNEVPGFKKQEIETFSVKGSILPRQRCDIVKKALEINATHILFVDCDQTFPAETLHRLLIQKKDVIAANVATKKIPSMPTARMKSLRWDGDPVYTPEGSSEVQKVWRVGTGIMLINRKVFDKIGLGVFAIPYRPEIQDYQGEDWSMCEAMEANGFDIWIDHGLSNRVGHIGDYSYDHNVVGEIQQEKIAYG